MLWNITISLYDISMNCGGAPEVKNSLSHCYIDNDPWPMIDCCLCHLCGFNSHRSLKYCPDCGSPTPNACVHTMLLHFNKYKLGQHVWLVNVMCMPHVHPHIKEDALLQATLSLFPSINKSLSNNIFWCCILLLNLPHGGNLVTCLKPTKIQWLLARQRLKCTMNIKIHSQWIITRSFASCIWLNGNLFLDFSFQAFSSNYAKCKHVMQTKVGFPWPQSNPSFSESKHVLGYANGSYHCHCCCHALVFCRMYCNCPSCSCCSCCCCWCNCYHNQEIVCQETMKGCRDQCSHWQSGIVHNRSIAFDQDHSNGIVAASIIIAVISVLANLKGSTLIPESRWIQQIGKRQKGEQVEWSATAKRSCIDDPWKLLPFNWIYEIYSQLSWKQEKWREKERENILVDHGLLLSKK